METPATSTQGDFSQEHNNSESLVSGDIESQTQKVENVETQSEGQISGSTLSTKGVAIDDDLHDEIPYDANEHGARRIIRNFTPSWFIITMGTGIVSILLYKLPYNGRWLRIISIIFFVLNIVLFFLFLIISCLRYILYPEIWAKVIRHPHQSLFLGTFPVGLATIINMIVFICVPGWGQHMVSLAWALWWIDSVLAVAICFHVTFVIMSNRRSKLAHMTALWLIPIVSIVIVASSGGIVAGVLPNPQHRLWTLIISYVFWGIGMPLSWIVLTIYFLRLTIHEPLPREVIVSALLPVGPLGLGSFSIISLGKLAKNLFPVTKSLPLVADAGNTIYVFGFMVGLILWAFAVIWFVIAVIMIVQVKHFPFNMGWWGFVFPIGIFTLATTTIGSELESRFFKVLGTVLAVCTVILWIVVAIGTVQRSITGKMFYAPCLGTDLKSKLKKGSASSGADEHNHG